VKKEAKKLVLEEIPASSHTKKKSIKEEVKEEASSSGTVVKKRKKVEEEEEVWKWWEEHSPDKSDDTVKWRTLEHKGPMFAPEYIPLPKSIHFKYDGKVFYSLSSRDFIQ
jgi:DNA topoisomerase-1